MNICNENLLVFVYIWHQRYRKARLKFTSNITETKKILKLKKPFPWTKSGNDHISSHSRVNFSNIFRAFNKLLWNHYLTSICKILWIQLFWPRKIRYEMGNMSRTKNAKVISVIYSYGKFSLRLVGYVMFTASFNQVSHVGLQSVLEPWKMIVFQLIL